MPEPSGVIVLDKPVGPTSRRVLDEVERRLQVGPLGHAGTLDPLASGLLVALSGRARRLQEFFLERKKTYVARVRFGQTSPTLDAEGPVAPTGIAPAPMTLDEATALAQDFVGDIEQTPPEFSALRVDGRRAHKLARRGRLPEMAPRPVSIRSISVQAIAEPDWIVEIVCGPGVYVRSLARDFGEARGCGAYLAGLRRTRSGSLTVADAIAPADAEIKDLRPLVSVLAAEPRIAVSEEESTLLVTGRVIERTWIDAPPRFAWFRDRPCFKLYSPSAGLLRSDLLIEEPLPASASE